MEGQYKPRTTGPLIFTSLRSKVISLLLKGLLTGVGEIALAGEENVGSGGQLSTN